jgi:hypothetical protein
MNRNGILGLTAEPLGYSVRFMTEAELDWGWDAIAVTLLWKLKPEGIVIGVADLVALPMDRVGIIQREADFIRLSFATEHYAKRLLERPAEHRPEVHELHGRWQKFCWVALWKLKRARSVTLSPLDRASVPSDRVLLQSGFKQDIEYRFVPREEAARLQRLAKEHEGRIITERSQLQ